jgi:serine phosphatase RsbU (regulator of sigma subunit)
MTPTKKTARKCTVPAWHADFLLMVPEIRRQTHALFQHLSPHERDEALAEVTAVAMTCYLENLEEGGKASFDPAALAESAALYVLNGGRACGRESSHDVLSPTAQHQRGFKVEQLKQSCAARRLRMRIDPRKDRGLPAPAAAATQLPQAHFPRLPTLPGPANGDDEDQSVSFAQERSRRHTAETRLEAVNIEFEAARRIQQKLFPVAAPALDAFEIAGRTWSADATGGDFFDYVPMRDDCVGVAICDVSGHGFGPALLMASTRAYLRAFAQTQSDLGELLSLVNRVLTLDMEDDRFATLFLARFDPRKRSLVYASAGHPTGYILGASGEVRMRLPSTGSLLGPASDATFSASPVVPIEPGELVLLLSDGVIEATAPDGAPFGWTRAAGIVRIYRDDPAAHIVYNLYHAVRAFSQNAPQVDDVTAVVIKVHGVERAANRENGGTVMLVLSR